MLCHKVQPNIFVKRSKRTTGSENVIYLILILLKYLHAGKKYYCSSVQTPNTADNKFSV